LNPPSLFLPLFSSSYHVHSFRGASDTNIDQNDRRADSFPFIFLSSDPSSPLLPFQMKTVLSNPEPLAALSSLVKSQLIYYASSAEALQAAHAEIEESALAAEATYRGSRQ
jgi:hypothetical protein